MPVPRYWRRGFSIIIIKVITTIKGLLPVLNSLLEYLVIIIVRIICFCII